MFCLNCCCNVFVINQKFEFCVKEIDNNNNNNCGEWNSHLSGLKPKKRLGHGKELGLAYVFKGRLNG